MAISAIAIFGLFLLLTFHFQQDKAYSPIMADLAFLPLTMATIAASTTSNIKLLPRFGPRMLVTAGMLVGAAGMFLLSQINVRSAYAGSLLAPLIILGWASGSPSARQSTWLRPG